MTIAVRTALKTEMHDPVLQDKDAPHICALIDTKFDAEATDLAAMAENMERLRRQLQILNVSEIAGLGDIAQGSTVMFLRSDVVFELQGLRAIARQAGTATRVEGTLAAAHCEAGHAAAALSKFRRGDLVGWSPFGVRMHRMGMLSAQDARVTSLKRLGQAPTQVARAMLLEATQMLSLDAKLERLWQRTPGLDRIFRSSKLIGLQKSAYDAFALTPGSWQAIGLLFGIMMLCFGAIGWTYFGAGLGVMAAITLDLSERAINAKNVRISNSAIAPSLQSLLVSLMWLFVVFAVPPGPVGQAAAFVLVAIPAAFTACLVLPDPHSALRPLAFGVYGQIALVTLTVVALPLGIGVVVLPLAALTVLLAIILQVAFAYLPKLLNQLRPAKPAPTAPSVSEPAQ